MTSPLDAVYEKYRHLDQCPSDPEWCNAGTSAPLVIAGELWRAVKEARNKPRPPCEECVHLSALGIKCPKCGAPTWIQLAGGFQTIFCYSARCDWKQQIRPDARDTHIAAQATAAENTRVLDELGKKIMAACGIVAGRLFDPNDDRIPMIGVDELGYISKSLRLAQPEPTEREPE